MKYRHGMLNFHGIGAWGARMVEETHRERIYAIDF